MVRFIRFIVDGNGLEALGILLLVLLVRWVFSLIIAPKTPDSDTLLGGNAPPPPALTPELAETSSSPVPMLLGIGILVVVVGSILIINFDSGGRLHVIASGKAPGREFDLRVDTNPVEPVLLVGQHHAYPISSGPHEVHLFDPGIGISRFFRVDIQEGDAFMLSVHSDTCAVQIDMSPLTYGRPTRRQRSGIDVRTLPVVARFTDTKSPLRIPEDAALSFNELPEKLPQGGTASILLPLPCAQAQDDRSSWAAVRTIFPGLDDAARRVGYTDEDPTRDEVSTMDNAQLLELHERQGAALARETPP
ncbi:hypothetical protein [Corallococcus aberystwythensis]|uniref:Uncharacterized protein n=1 Tax=Corallococcus aberystwythensis TaxID=2316722 RepID=A0A3A8PWY3_9BACT|nr:hypothetical protein [Corallococcus aberystwythensis]RKH60883.1 hypothetical protein D7W81_24835 [Corallococcus aberystwythensis]